MKHHAQPTFIILISSMCLALVIGLAYYSWQLFVPCCEPPAPVLITNESTIPGKNSDAVTPVEEEVEEITSITAAPEIQIKQFTTNELEAVVLPMNFTATIPETWQVEYIPEALAINFYDPTSDGASPLEQSQVFVKYFEASQFLTLQTVTIHAQEDLTINDQPTVRYDIEKKSGVANFANQPTWRSARHYVTDIRSSDTSPTLFYVFGQNPDLDDETFFNVLESITFN